MKKLLFLIIAIGVSTLVSSQDLVIEDDFSSSIMSSSLTIDCKPRIYSCNNDDKNNIYYDIYNCNLEKEKRIKINSDVFNIGYITYSRAPELHILYVRREVIFNEPGLSEYIESSGELEIGSDKSVDAEGNTIYVYEWYSGEEHGKKYPLSYSYHRNDTLYSVYNEYGMLYTGEWESEDRRSDTYIEPMRTRYYNFDANKDEAISSTFSQNIFNNDDKYEYIMPEYEIVVDERHHNELDTDGDGIIDKYSIITSLKNTGYNIVSEDGTIISEIPLVVDAELYYIYKFGNMLYFVYFNYEKYGCIIYKYNPVTSSVNKVSAFPFFKISPNVAKKNTFVDVSIDDEKAQNGGEIIVVDIAGKIVYTSKLDPGISTVQIPTHNMSSGMYVVTLISDGKSSEAAKLIIR